MLANQIEHFGRGVERIGNQSEQLFFCHLKEEPKESESGQILTDLIQFVEHSARYRAHWPCMIVSHQIDKQEGKDAPDSECVGIRNEEKS